MFDVPMGHCWYPNVMPTLELKPTGVRSIPATQMGSNPQGQERLSPGMGAQDSQIDREAWTHIKAQLSG